MKLRLSTSVKLLAPLALLATLTLPALGEEAAVLLSPPGLRPVKNPSIIIPVLHAYPNRTLSLPDYRDSSGRVSEEWAVERIRTRRFFSNRSARLYFRSSDLARTTTFKASGALGEMRIWPSGTLMVLEIYEGDGSMERAAKPIEIAVMEKLVVPLSHPPHTYYTGEWSYAKFTPEGASSLLPDEARDCHHCHSIAFQLTGDLIFTRFP